MNRFPSGNTGGFNPRDGRTYMRPPYSNLGPLGNGSFGRSQSTPSRPAHPAHVFGNRHQHLPHPPPLFNMSQQAQGGTFHRLNAALTGSISVQTQHFPSNPEVWQQNQMQMQNAQRFFLNGGDDFGRIAQRYQNPHQFGGHHDRAREFGFKQQHHQFPPEYHHAQTQQMSFQIQQQTYFQAHQQIRQPHADLYHPYQRNVQGYRRLPGNMGFLEQLLERPILPRTGQPGFLMRAPMIRGPPPLHPIPPYRYPPPNYGARVGTSGGSGDAGASSAKGELLRELLKGKSSDRYKKNNDLIDAILDEKIVDSNPSVVTSKRLESLQNQVDILNGELKRQSEDVENTKEACEKKLDEFKESTKSFYENINRVSSKQVSEETFSELVEKFYKEIKEKGTSADASCECTDEEGLDLRANKTDHSIPTSSDDNDDSSTEIEVIGEMKVKSALVIKEEFQYSQDYEFQPEMMGVAASAPVGPAHTTPYFELSEVGNTQYNPGTSGPVQHPFGGGAAGDYGNQGFDQGNQFQAGAVAYDNGNAMGYQSGNFMSPGNQWNASYYDQAHQQEVARKAPNSRHSMQLRNILIQLVKDKIQENKSAQSEGMGQASQMPPSLPQPPVSAPRRAGFFSGGGITEVNEGSSGPSSAGIQLPPSWFQDIECQEEGTPELIKSNDEKANLFGMKEAENADEIEATFNDKDNGDGDERSRNEDATNTCSKLAEILERPRLNNGADLKRVEIALDSEQDDQFVPDETVNSNLDLDEDEDYVNDLDQEDDDESD